MPEPADVPPPDHEGRGLRAALDMLRSLLVPGEKLEAYAVQRRLFALMRRRIIVAATSGRFILLARGIFGGFTPRDVRWQDLRDARVRAGVLAADLTLAVQTAGDLATVGGAPETIAVTGLRKDQAAAVYRICQAQEQSWREKRRIRDLEELRAKSGGVYLNTPPVGPAGAPAAQDSEDPVARLQRAKEMLQKGLITDSEYESIKAKIVSGL